MGRGISTVLFIIQKNQQILQEDIIRLFREWSEDKAKRFSENYMKILFVCHGNICRSPMAEFVMKDMIEKAGMAIWARLLIHFMISLTLQAE